ncbi:MAG: homoserine dehydrogenase [Planctomycetota bacterium]
MSRSISTTGVAIVGCGTVGGAAATLLTRDSGVISERLGADLELRHIVDVDFTHARELGLDEKLFRKDLREALSDEEVSVVVELIGGIDTARDFIEQALQAGKHVVTANKALLAHHGAELMALARDCGVSLCFEASCGGGIPVIRALVDGLIANHIDAIFGIVNGTCNYILTAMTRQNTSFSDALAQAQRQGLAEADPTLDVSGGDSAHKLAIMAALAFGRRVDFDTIPVEGIDTLEACDVAFGQELGYVIKLLAIAERRDDALSLRVRPAFISTEHPLAWVSGPFNAVSVYGHATGHTMYYGRGAGDMPTGSAVVADIASVATGTAQRQFEQLKLWPDLAPPAEQLPASAVRSRYYLRMMAQDRPGVLAQVANVLGRHNISIRSVLQHEPAPGSDIEGVNVVITTHIADEGNIRKAITEVDELEVIKAPTVCISIVDEHPEDL